MVQPTFYSELLRNPFWQKKRLLILDRDNFTCQKCGDCLRNLQIHHLGYLRDTMPWEYPDTMLVTYCELCHEKAEFMKWLVRNSYDLLTKSNFVPNDIREIIALVNRRVTQNMHDESVRNYMKDIKFLLNNG